MEKPLPDLPQPSKLRLKDTPAGNPVTLTVDASVHLHNFIVQAIQDEADGADGLADGAEDWASALEGALASLGERIAMGGWLPGIRRARMKRWTEKERIRVRERASSSSPDSTEPSIIKKDEPKAKDTDSPRPQSFEEHSYLSIGWSHPKQEQSWHVSFTSLRDAASHQVVPTPKPTAKHLVLTAAPFGAIPFDASEEANYEFLPRQIECIFTANVFSLPQGDTSETEAREVILLGLDSWDWDMTALEDPIQVVGGTFSFKGITTQAQYASLRKVLKLATFVFLSNILEQCVLSNSRVPLRFSKPALSPTIPTGQQDGIVARALSTSNVGHKPKHESVSVTSWWAYLSRKKDNLLQHTPSAPRRSSLELPFTRSLTREVSPGPRARTSTDNSTTSPTARSRRLSFISDYRPSFLQSHPSPSAEPTPVERPFAAALTRIERYSSLLSTSPSVTYPAPSLLVTLAEREKHDPARRLGGDEKGALASLLGWEGKQACGAGVADMAGFVRQQSFSMLYSEYVYVPTTSISRPTTPSTPSTSTSQLSQSPAQNQSHAVLCGRRRRWMTSRFFSRDGAADDCLGDTLSRLCSRADEPCDEPNCKFKHGEHELRCIHGTVRITISVGGLSESYHADDGEEELPEIWQSCGVCSKETPTERMHDGTYLFSFAKYLELLVYSTAMCTIIPPICSHTTLPPRPWNAADSPLPQARMNIIRHFSLRGRTISFSLSPVDDVYEVRVPRLQILKTRPNEKPNEVCVPHPAQLASLDATRRVLRREIMQFWQGLSDHMDSLEGNFVDEQLSAYHKTLPRLPSADDQYDNFDGDGLATPKGQPSGLPALPPNTPKTPPTPKVDSDYPFPHKSIDARTTASQLSHSESMPSTLSSSSTDTSGQDSLQLLTNLRHKFQRTEQDLYNELSRTSNSSLNDVRRSFLSAGRGATKRLSAWEAKHAAGSTTTSDFAAGAEPEWWKPGCHAVPGGNVIVREDDWGSIIAFTLSSADYQKELVNMSLNRSPMPILVPPPTPQMTRPSFFNTNASSKWFGSTVSTPDPDQDGIVWHEPETYSAVITRREHPRDPTSLLKLGIPDVLRQKVVGDTGSPGPSRFATIGLSSGKGFVGGMPPLAWAKPDVQVSMQEADGLLSATAVDKVDRVLQELEAASDHTGSVRTSSSDNRHSTSSFVETNIRRGKASSFFSTAERETPSSESLPPTPPPKDSPGAKDSQRSRDGSAERADSTPMTPPTPSMLANTLSSALRYMLRTGEPQTPPARHHHGLLSATASPAIDDKPHIKYDWTIGKRLKFSCTAYYAKQFDALRRRCGIEDTFLQSLARCENWAAEGGKSRSNFWKTTDNQFIIKTLVNAWNVADLHVLIEFGPSYFRYMDATMNKPTVLAKLLGFYTVEIRNLETGSIQAKADLLVMENLFYGQSIIKTFDLKGIQGRKVKPSNNSSGSKTLFDGEWIEGQQRTLTIVRPYSKVVLQDAIKADCDFLMRSNIMDYSLLVGIDETKKQLVCGLVDTIGSYTFAKTLEYKAKQGLNSGKEVTVMPPNEYQERFVNAMDHYFVACPDKWSRPLDDTKIPSDYRQLPSVL